MNVRFGLGLIIGALVMLWLAATPAAAQVPAPPPPVAVTSYGAVCNGTTDDTVAFQSALNAVSAAGGGIVSVPAGTCSVQPSHIVVPSNVTLSGAGPASTRIVAKPVATAAFGTSLLDIQGVGAGVTALTLDGQNLALRGLTIDKSSSRVSVTNTKLQNFTQPSDPADQSFHDVPAAIRVAGNGDAITIDTVNIDQVWANNTNDPWPHKVARGVWIVPATGEKITTNVTIKNSTFGNVGPKDDGDCIVIQDSSDTANLTISGNTFNSCHKRAIKIQVPGVTATGNTINNPFLNNNAYETWTNPPAQDMWSAISVYASNVTLDHNIISGVGSFYAAIDMDAGSCAGLSNLTVQNNDVKMGSGSTTLTGASLIRAFIPVAGLTIANNILDVAQTAIAVHPGVSNLSLSANTIGPAATIPFNYFGSNCLGSPAPLPTPSGPGVQTLAVPAYFAPGAGWTQLESGAPTVGLAVMNPNNGPGTPISFDYVNQVQHSRAKGLTVLGYVHTSYGARAAADVKAEIDRYYAWYDVDGIFFDEASTDCTIAPYYADLNSYVKAKGGTARTVINPGATAASDCYMATADIVVTFEGSASTYASAPAAPSWVSSYPANRFWHLIHTATATQDMQNAITASKQRGAGWVFVTPNSITGNTWGSLPADPYWSSELTAARAGSTTASAAAPTLTSLAPQSAQAGSAGTTVSVTGTNFGAGSTVQWNGAALPTTVVSSTQLTASVPASDLTSATTAQVTVISASGTSSGLPFFVTASGASLSASNTSPPGSSTASVGGTGSGTNGSLTATGNGAGSVSVADYTANPTSVAPPANVNISNFVDVYAAPGSSFTSLAVVDCNLTPGNTVTYWFDGTNWSVVSNQTYNPATGCVTMNLSSGTSPSLLQLAGTPFGVGQPPQVVASFRTADGKAYVPGTWTNQAVTATFSCSPAGGASPSQPNTVATEGAGQAVTGTCTFAGTQSVQKTFGNIQIDKTPPTVTYTGDSGTYTVDQTLSITCTAADPADANGTPGSGLASTTCQNVTGPAYSFPLGTNTLSASAIDNAGNSGKASTSFDVKVTYSSLCTLTTRFVERSAKFTSLSPIQQAAATLAANTSCQLLSSAVIAPTPEQKAQLIAAYQAGMTSLLKQGWLTADQANILISLSKAL